MASQRYPKLVVVYVAPRLRTVQLRSQDTLICLPPELAGHNLQIEECSPRAIARRAFAGLCLCFAEFANLRQESLFQLAENRYEAGGLKTLNQTA